MLALPLKVPTRVEKGSIVTLPVKHRGDRHSTPSILANAHWLQEWANKNCGPAWCRLLTDALDRSIGKRQVAGALEKRLWDAADQFRANSGLKSQEYSAPVLGLIFLRFAEVRFAAQRAKLEKAGASVPARLARG